MFDVGMLPNLIQQLSHFLKTIFNVIRLSWEITHQAMLFREPFSISVCTCYIEEQKSFRFSRIFKKKIISSQFRGITHKFAN